MKEFPDPPVSVDSIAPEALKARIDDGERVTILDTRPEEMFEEWAIDGETVEQLNIPHTSFHPEFDESVLDQLPTDRQITTVCAVGESSAYIAGLLAERGYEVDHLEDGMNGWARIYERTRIERYNGAGEVYQYHRPSSGCLGYLVVDGDEAAVVDPLRAFTDRYLEDADAMGINLRYAIDTHIHADHISGVRALTASGVDGVLPARAAARGVTDPETFTLIEDGDELVLGDVTIEAVFTPGHTSGMTSYLVDEALLLTGDGLFVESVARPDLEDGDDGAPDAARTLYESLQTRILTLPEETLIGAAHHSGAVAPAEDGTYTASIGTIRERMPALSMEKAAFVEFVLADMPPRPANFEDIIATNLGTRETDDEEAFELELGPNNCAATADATAD